MEPALDLTMWLSLCSVGFVAGFIDAIVGGGGMLTIPTLLTAGLPPHIALGTNKLAASFGSFVASLTFYRKKLFTPSYWKSSLVATAIGAISGTLLISQMSTDFLEKLLPLIIVFTAIYTLFSKNNTNNQNELPKKSPSVIKKQIIQGLTLGFYDGAIGPGTGAFWTASSTALYRINILLSCGIARSANFISNICSLFTFVYLGYVNIALGITMGLFLMLGSWIGAHSAIKFGSKFIRPMFICIVMFMSFKLAFDAWM